MKEELCEESRKCKSTTQEVVQAAIKAYIHDIPLEVIVDTGATVSVISDSLFQVVKERFQVPTLPVSNCRVTGALGAKAQIVREQVLAELAAGNEVYRCPFLVVKGLSTPCILGLDFLREKQATLDFARGKCFLTDNHRENVVDLIKTQATHGKFCRRLNIKKRKWKTLKDQYLSEELLFISNLPPSGTEIKDINIEEINQQILQSEVLSTFQQEELCHLLERYASVFSNKPGVIKGFMYNMDVFPHQIYCRHTYSVPWAKREAVTKEIKRMLDWGVIEPSLSPYCNPLLPVSKLDGSVRLVLDAREINKIIVPVKTHPENIEELIQRFHGVKYLTSLDLRSSYWQVQLTEESRKYTAFIFAGRSYHFKVLPFGLSVSAGVFITALDYVLGPDLLERVVLYVDDLLIATKTWEEHLELTEKVLMKFSMAGVTVNLQKSKFGRSSLKFLGHIISHEGILPDPRKLDAISNLPYPTTKKQLKTFFGAVSFFRRFIPNQLLNSEPLLKLLRKNTPWIWTNECTQEFNAIKNALIQANILSHPDMSQDFCLVTDTSNYGLGACLFQVIEENGKRQVKVIGFASRVLSACERAYSTTELEALAIIWALRKFHYYVYGKHIKIYCDHQALSFLMTCKLLHERLARWALALQDYQFEIIYIKGQDNVIADMLSRLPQGLPEYTELIGKNTEFKVLLMKDLENRHQFLYMCKNVANLQDQDLRWNCIKQKVLQRTDPKINQHYKIANRILYFRHKADTDQWKICIPTDTLQHLVNHTHNAWGHFGASKCAKKIGQYFYFPNLRRCVSRILSTCTLCQRTKPLNKCCKSELHPIIPIRPLQLISLDVSGPHPTSRGGVKYLVGVIDIFTKYLKLYTTKTSTAAPIIRKLVQDYIPTVGKPENIITDNATYFTGKAWTEFLRDNDINQILISRFHPSSNPIERTFRDFNRFVRTYAAHKQTKWADLVEPYQEIVNHLPHSSTSFTPAELMWTKQEHNDWTRVIPSLPKEKIPHQDKIKEASRVLTSKARQRKAKFDSKIKTIQQFRIGDKILLRNYPKSSLSKKINRKWQHLFIGPFIITSIPHPGSYFLAYPQSLKPKGLYNHCDIRKYTTR